jgi:SAM-dependent methyltransferase
VRQHLAERPLLVPHPDHEKSRTEALRRFDEAVDLMGEDARFDKTKVEWRHPVDAARLPFEDASFDVVISNAAFEHFLEPETAIREAMRVLAPNGVGIHQIDLRDHRDFSKPLDFLRYEDEEWRRLHSDMVCYTNRLRFKDFERAFAATGVVEVAQVNLSAQIAPEVRATFHSHFRDRDDLEALSALFVVRKPS